MSLETIQTEIAALRNDVKNLTKLVRKVKNTQEDPDGEKAKKRAENNGFNRKQEITPKLREFLALPEGELISPRLPSLLTSILPTKVLSIPRTAVRLFSTISFGTFLLLPPTLLLLTLTSRSTFLLTTLRRLKK